MKQKDLKRKDLEFKLKDLEFGSFEAGPFIIQICPALFDKRSADVIPFFEVMISEDRTVLPVYINLVEDKRFGLFSHFGTFNKVLRSEEWMEYNSYFWRKHMKQPTWKLSRTTLGEVFELAQKAKKRTNANVLDDFAQDEIESKRLLIFQQMIKDGKI